MTATQTARERITAVVDASFHDTGYSALETAVSGLVGDTLAAFDRWSCNDPECPARPASDIALGTLYDDVDTWVDDAYALVRERLADRLSTILEAHPETPWKDSPAA